ncbi:unnamed protein product [Oikopleura dioica]|uniref:Uncharacterized protein n=1 Tax=Oikopleura dioica TaxID=34765 RepID=E4X5G7_OIKDI|nr:unnamed protein product [Oikopleura dioica]
MLKNNDEIFVDQEKLSQQKRDPVDDNALWNISKMKRDMRQLQAQLRELDDRNSTLENKQSRALEQTDILEGHLNRASREQSDLLNMSISSSNRSLDRINESMTDQMIRVRDEMRVTDDENNRLIYELDQLKRDHEETERELRQALREATSKPNVDDYDKLMSEYTSALDKIEKQEEKLEQASVSSKADDLQSHLDQSRAECDLYEEEIGELKKKISVLEAKLKSSGRQSPNSEIHAVQALPVHQELVQSSGPPLPEASEEEGTQVDREKVKNAAILKKMKDREDEIEELKQNLAKSEAEKKVLEDKIFDAGEAQLNEDELKAEIARLTAENEALRKDLENEEKEEKRKNAFLLKELGDKNDEVNNFNDELKGLQNNFENEKTEKNEMIKQLEKDIQKKDDEIKELQDEVAGFNEDLEQERRNKAVLLKKLKDREDELENELNEALKDKDDQIGELENLNDALFDANKELKSDNANNEDHKAAKILALKNLADKEKEIKKLNSQLQEIKEEKASLENDVEKLFLERNAAKEELDELANAHKDLMNELQHAADESNDHKLAKLAALKKIKELEAEKKELQEQCDTYAEQLEAASEMSEIDEKSLADAKHQNKLLNQTLDSVKSSVEDLKNASFQEDKETEEKIQALEEEKSEKIKVIKNLEETIESLEEQIEDLNGENEKSRDEKLKTLAKIKLLEDAQNEKEDLEDELEKNRSNLAALEKKIKDQDEAIQDLEEELNNKTTEIVNLKQKVFELESELATDKGDKAKALLVTKELNDRKEEIDFLKEEIENLKSENCQLAKNQKSEDDRKKKLLVSKELAERKEEIKKLNKELDELKKSQTKVKTKDQSTKTLPKPTSSKTMQTEKIKNEKMVNKQVNTLFDMKRVEEIKQMAEELKRENAKLKETQESEDDRAKKALVAKELVERKEEIKRLEKDLEKLDIENKDLLTQAEENKDNKAAKLLIAKELKDREDEIAQLKQALALEEQNAKNAADPNKIIELEDEIAALEDERDRALAKIKGLEKDLEFSKVLEDEVDKKEKEILAKDEQIQAYEETIAENNRKLKDLLVLKKAAEKVSETEAANETLKTEISEIKEERDELKSELEELRNAQDADSSAEGLEGKKPLTGSTKTLDSGIFDKTHTLEDIPLGSSSENIRSEPQMIIIQRLQVENERLIAERDSVGDIETLKKEYQDEKAHLEEDLDHQQQKLTQLTGELQKLLQDKAGLEEDLELKNEDLQAVEEDLEDVKSKLKKVQVENDELVDDNESRLKELVALKALKDRSGTIDDLENDRDELKQALVAHKTVEQLKLLNENGEEELAKLNDAYQDLEAELREKDAEMEQIEEQLQNNKFEKAKTLAALKALRKSVETGDEESDSSEEESDIFVDANDQSKPEEIINDIKKVLVVKKGADNRKDIENLEEQIADLEDENDELKAQNEKLEEIRKKHKDEIEKLTEENEILHEDVQSRPSSIAIAPIVEQQQVQSTNPFLQTHSDIESSIQPDEPKTSTLLRELENENERLMNEIRDLKAQLDLSRTEMKFITAEKSDSGSSSGDLAEENESLRAEVKRLAALVAMYKGRDSDDEVDLRPAKRTDSVPDLLEADTQKNLKEGVLHELTNTQKKLKEEEDKRQDLERVVDKLNETIEGLQTPEAQQRLKDGALSELEREKKRRSEAENELEKAKNEAELAKELKEGALAEVDRLNSSLISSKLEELEKTDSKSSSRQSTPIPSKKLDELELQTMENEVQLQALRPDASELAKKSPEEQDKILEDFKKTLEAKARDIAELEQEIEELKDENKELKVEAYDAQNYKKKFKKTVDEKHAQGQDLEELTTLYDQLLLKNDELKQKLARCRNELELLQEPYDQKLFENAQNSNRRLSDSLLIRIPSPEGRMLKNNDEIFVDQEKLSQQKRDPVDDNALWNISKMKRDMRQLQAQLRELDDRNSTLENKQSRALEQTDILEGTLEQSFARAIRLAQHVYQLVEQVSG